jgi:hypothetical protein
MRKSQPRPGRAWSDALVALRSGYRLPTKLYKALQESFTQVHVLGFARILHNCIDLIKSVQGVRGFGLETVRSSPLKPKASGVFCQSSFRE